MAILRYRPENERPQEAPARESLPAAEKTPGPIGKPDSGPGSDRKDPVNPKPFTGLK